MGIGADFAGHTRTWFQATHRAPTQVQRDGWAAISSGEHALLVAPTGSGKTLASFLWAIDGLLTRHREGQGVRLLYVSPLKALNYDIERNLRAPLHGVRELMVEAGLDPPEIAVGVRTGDTSQSTRASILRRPPEILITTPESLYLLLTSVRAREILRTVETVIVDEIHAVASSKRGTHLVVSLERLEELTSKPPQRIGLSATVRPPQPVAALLGGLDGRGEPRPVTVVDASGSEGPGLDLRVEYLAGSAADEPPEGINAGRGFTEACRRVVDYVRSHRATLVFAPSRGQVEHMVQVVNEIAGTDLVQAHHGSIARERRRELELALKDGEVAGIVCTSSLEMGIDIGELDLVVCYGSPRSVSAALQRVGRSGHRVGAVRKGRILSPHPTDLLECAALAQGMVEADLEPVAVPDNCLDVLAQHVVSMVAVEPRRGEDLLSLVRRAKPFCELSDAQFENVLDMLEGRYSDERYRELEPRILRDTATGMLHPRRGARLLATTNGGTIPDRGDYAVRLDTGDSQSPKIGELDEEFTGDLARDRVPFILGASEWRMTRFDHSNVYVVPAPGEPAAVAFWNGEKNGRSTHLGRRVAALARSIGDDLGTPESLRERLVDASRLDDTGADVLMSWLAEQKDATGVVPGDRDIVVEWFHDEIGDLRIVIHSLFGYAVNGAWAHAIKPVLRDRFGNLDPQVTWTSDGVVLRLPLMEGDPDIKVLDRVTASNVGELLLGELADAPMYAWRFRESAQRALLLPRPSPVRRTPLWLQRQRAADLLSVVRRKEGFPIVHEAVRECYQEMWDVEGLRQLLRGIESGEIRRTVVASQRPSPMAAALDWTFAQAFREDGDRPRGECRAAFLALNRDLLAEILRVEELRELLDPAAVAPVLADLARTAEGRRARDPAELLAILTDQGDLDDYELAARCTDPDLAAGWISELARDGRIVRHATLRRWVAARDAKRTAASLLVRRTRWAGPVTLEELAVRYELDRDEAANLLDQQVQTGGLVAGHYLPGGTSREWCEPDVLARLHRRSLARARERIRPVPLQRWAAFVAERHVSGCPDAGSALDLLADIPLPVRAWEHGVLPARLEGFRPEDLDAACASGNFLWWGAGRGLVAVTRRTCGPAGWNLAGTGSAEEPGGVSGRIAAQLAQGGGWFATELAARPEVSVDDDVAADALFRLVWSGRAGTDMFGAFRWWVSHRPDDPGAPLPGRTGSDLLPGRWQAVSAHDGKADAAAVADALLDRYGVVTKASLRAERRHVRWVSVYQELRRREWRGEVVRGLFVDGLDGAQFARARTIDALRDRTPSGAPVLLAGADPANVWGRVVEVPGGRPDAWKARNAGSFIVTDAGNPVLLVGRWGRSLWPVGDPRHLQPQHVSLLSRLARWRGRTLRVEQWDAAPVAGSRGERLLAAAGYPSRGGTVPVPAATRQGALSRPA